MSKNQYQILVFVPNILNQNHWQAFELDLFQKDYKAYRIRQFVKPGVTGPAQCRGLRGEFTDSDLVNKRIKMDFDYVGNWSVWLDFEILIRTIGQVLFPPKSAC